MNPLFRIDFSISDSLKIVRKSVLIYETIIFQTNKGWPNNFCACVMNGDGSANAAHIDGVTNSESALKVVLDRSQSNMLLRVCYTIFYWY